MSFLRKLQSQPFRLDGCASAQVKNNNKTISQPKEEEVQRIFEVIFLWSQVSQAISNFVASFNNVNIKNNVNLKMRLYATVFVVKLISRSLQVK